jgi:hypothetical protein
VATEKFIGHLSGKEIPLLFLLLFNLEDTFSWDSPLDPVLSCWNPVILSHCCSFIMIGHILHFCNGSSTPREEHGLMVFGLEREEVTGEWRKFYNEEHHDYIHFFM